MAQSLAVVAVFIGVVTFSFGMVALVRKAAMRWNHVDVPNDRSSHMVPMPLGGGVVLVVINAAGWALLGHFQPIISWRHILAFAIGALIIACVSFVDDLGHVPYAYRLGVQALGASVFLAGFGSLDTVTVPLLGRVTLGVAGLVVSLLWIIGLTNAFNFLDGSDGLAAGQAVAAGLGWTALGLLTDSHVIVAVGALLAATSLGFLLHNWHPATIFMGDTGSTFLGFSFAALTVVAARHDSRLALAGVLLVWPVVFDSAFTVFARLRRRESVFAGHRGFLFHRLMDVGWDPRAIAGLYTTLPILGGLLAFSWDRGTPAIHVGVAVGLITLCLSLWLLVRDQELHIVAGSNMRLHPVAMTVRATWESAAPSELSTLTPAPEALSRSETSFSVLHANTDGTIQDIAERVRTKNRRHG